MIIAVDPGLRVCGVSIFNEKRLIRAFLAHGAEKGNGPKAWAEMALGVMSQVVLSTAFKNPGVALVLEGQKVYQGGKQKGDPADLLELAGVCGYLASYFPVVVRVFPHEWKGQMTKATTEGRVYDRLDETERGAIEVHGAKTHNVLDAIGLGLFYCGRFEPKRVIHR